MPYDKNRVIFEVNLTRELLSAAEADTLRAIAENNHLADDSRSIEFRKALGEHAGLQAHRSIVTILCRRQLVDPTVQDDQCIFRLTSKGKKVVEALELLLKALAIPGRGDPEAPDYQL